MSQPPLSPTQPDLSPGSQTTLNKKRKQLDVDSSDEERASRAPLTQPTMSKGGPGPYTRNYYTNEEIESELSSIKELLEEIKEHIEKVEKFLKLH